MLLSAASAPGTIDSTFGVGGMVTGYRLAGVQPDGTILADPQSGGATVVLNPDGSLKGPYNPPPQPPVTQVIFPYFYDMSITSLTRRNSSDGSIDKSFGDNGTVTDFSVRSTNRIFRRVGGVR